MILKLLQNRPFRTDVCKIFECFRVVSTLSLFFKLLKSERNSYQFLKKFEASNWTYSKGRKFPKEKTDFGHYFSGS